jgi:hypothetical protein
MDCQKLHEVLEDEVDEEDAADVPGGTSYTN